MMKMTFVLKQSRYDCDSFGCMQSYILPVNFQEKNILDLKNDKSVFSYYSKSYQDLRTLALFLKKIQKQPFLL